MSKLEVPDRLAPALARLDRRSIRDAAPTFDALLATLGPGEQVQQLVQGWTKGLLCVVARTDRRVLVVVSRFPDPLVESLHPTRTRVSLYGPPGTDRASLTVVDGRRLLEVTGIRDGAEAAAICSAPAGPKVRSQGYF